MMMKLLVCLCLVLVAISLTKAIPGGFKKLDVNSDAVKSKAQFALESIAQQTGTNRSLRLAKIESAESQIVSGVNYRIGLVVCEQDSAKENQLINKDCRYCAISVWEQSWLNSTKVTNVNCSEPGNLESLSSASLNKME
ncbi:cystatin-like [Daktulosphaira vitifoliae]|uniref:cystatin-like n=1 Tax=Daktulosphaira vitifoliae TaxID=58002 RepID=UPI0021AA56BC|nr:cystatin-like [Daktulosphaira vitifoliae]